MPLNPWQSPPATVHSPRHSPRHSPSEGSPLRGGGGGGGDERHAARSVDEKLLVLQRRCEEELGEDGYELLHSLCLANGGQLMRPINLDALPVSLRLLGEETLMTYVPVVEQVAFLQLQEHRG